MCFAHYKSSSPSLSAKATENEQNVPLACTTLGSAYDRRHVTNKTAVRKIRQHVKKHTFPFYSTSPTLRLFQIQK